MDLNYDDPKVKQAMEIYQLLTAIGKFTAKLAKKNAENFGLSLQQLSILNTLLAFPESTQQELAERLVLSKSTISVGIDKLVNMGLIERKLSTEDRREVKLQLTLKGEELAKKSSKNAIPYQAMIYAIEKMPEEDIQSLLRIQQELLNHLNEYGY
ncbi:MarR family transcriptional regulator [Weizmannia coagulans]|jgi:DNA-binding MarR family transcriptional regulator|uniref:MarR family transcriptional regulator n=4 Tax=Bacillaceae TaxID=186817 RepID=A0AAN0WB34_HEYCO|nr:MULTISPECIES: MarR family transcriptional regulator [Heyndrickxia]AJO21811.1 MarR family transcriptional regulator [Heyndrickxia coagulans]ATW82286.1 MarR family transcriptional regulator [Heyndrickxia coagulans]AVD57052.1 MarR family transcriptional regulator [Heyndrickxia coagulans]AWP37992.1 MarR family transcriptional regulator [Heyndrickxia coagulans]KGB29236.1 MarR family transcriptional regulator [Heyndrickxia coagulans]